MARESARRFLFTTLLMSWANQRFGLTENGQRGMVYHGPHPPVRQTELSSCISDAFYRELFMSPCLSGWDDGEAKAEYMHLCHQVLSRSQLNSVAKLREAGHHCQQPDCAAEPVERQPGQQRNSRQHGKPLADPGVARRRTADTRSGKRSGWAILPSKSSNTFFLCLWAPIRRRRIASTSRSSIPSVLLAFLPHELDFTHLRLMWREWKEKAKLKILGRPATPYGPPWLDRAISGVFRLRGDLVPDYRLLNYPVAWLSTEHASALGRRARKHGAPGGGAWISSASSIGACRSTCRCACVNSDSVRIFGLRSALLQPVPQL